MILRVTCVKLLCAEEGGPGTKVTVCLSFFHCVLGELTQPGNFSFHDVNATHIILSWNEPFSWVQPSDVVYVLTQNGSYTSKTVELRTHSFPLLRPPGGLYARLTPWNPVGEGESSTLNLTDSVLGCDKISMLNQRA